MIKKIFLLIFILFFLFSCENTQLNKNSLKYTWGVFRFLKGYEVNGNFSKDYQTHDKTIKIRDYYKGYKVFRIWGFDNSVNLETVYLPKHLSIIRDNAFYNSSIKRVVFQQDSPFVQFGIESFKLSKIEEIDLYHTDPNGFMYQDLRKIVVCDEAFAGSNLNKIYFPLRCKKIQLHSNSLSTNTLKEIYLSNSQVVIKGDPFIKDCDLTINFYCSEQDADNNFINYLLERKIKYKFNCKY